ncbi:MAG: LysM peptidoglycan-binding domain-containing protein [Anaerolineae bacterium]|nr:LysM peptidoglycan-binding domain-containing protein [Anaerolineae bacterium]
MNIEVLIAVFFIAVAIVWAFWLIFRKDMFSINLSKLLFYFAGVILTLLLVAWMTVKFLPWWAVQLVEDTTNSQDVKDLQTISQQLWDSATNAESTITKSTPIPPQPTSVAPSTDTTPVAPQPTPAAETGAGQSAERTHTVQTGDTLYKLSQQYGVSVDAIRQRNNLTGDTIKVGQTLIIPAP